MQALKRAWVLGAVVLGLAFGAASAAANTVNITVNGVTYTLTASRLSYSADAALLQAQPWWGNEPLAFAITSQLGYQLGDLQGGPGTIPGIPSALMAYGIDGPDVSITFWDGSAINCPINCPTQVAPFFYVTSVTAARPVPAVSDVWTLALLALAVGGAGVLTARALRPAQEPGPS